MVEGPLDSLMPSGVLRKPVEVNPYRRTFRCDEIGAGLFRLGGSYNGRALEIPVQFARNGDSKTIEIDLDNLPELIVTGRAFVGDTDHPLRDAEMQVELIARWDRSRGTVRPRDRKSVV